MSAQLPDGVSPDEIDNDHDAPSRIYMETTAVVAVRAEAGVTPHDGLLITGEVAEKGVRETLYVEELDGRVSYNVLVRVVVPVRAGGDEERRAKDKVEDKLEVIVTDEDIVDYADHHDTKVEGRA
jgi:hypothetical protein